MVHGMGCGGIWQLFWGLCAGQVHSGRVESEEGPPFLLGVVRRPRRRIGPDQNQMLTPNIVVVTAPI